MGLKERRKREKELRRKQILDAARALLLKRGISSTSMNRIARDAELSVGTLYIYFKNKEDLYAELQEEGLNLLYDKVKEAKERGNDPQDTLRDIAIAYLDFSEENRNYFDIINYFLSAPEIIFPPHLKSRIDLQGKRILSLIEEVLGDIDPVRGISEGLVKRYAIILWSSLHGMLQLRKLKNTILKDQDFRELYLSSAMLTISSITAKKEDDVL
ncbi:MAG: TetR/AcrR family transcriptional regulator [Deltaproteobacteria bacterium]|nr:TetR/AcrR family transcriptional regulator [Deltaproteobacteria bacterium]MBN2845342.1 TetR/AcrR family transcriptional regulator [Deltaproteobacteria bacterium]